MDENTMVVAIMGQLCGTALLITVLTLWFRRRRQPSVTAPESMHRIETRLTELQHAVDSVAVEVERISEGQRFTTKLLSERVPSLASADSRQAEPSTTRR